MKIKRKNRLKKTSFYVNSISIRCCQNAKVRPIKSATVYRSSPRQYPSEVLIQTTPRNYITAAVRAIANLGQKAILKTVTTKRGVHRLKLTPLINGLDYVCKIHSTTMRNAWLIILIVTSFFSRLIVQTAENCPCENWREEHPEWIWCDDFEDRAPLSARYFEYGDNGGDFIPMDGVGVGGSRGMRARFQKGEVSAGGFKKSFGRTPGNYIGRHAERSEEDFAEVYWRMWLRLENDWIGGGAAKLTRATVMANEGWAQGMIAHLWSGGPGDHYLLIDPASGISTNGQLVSTRYNDFQNLRWLGYQRGMTPLFNNQNVGQWFCIEVHVKLNTPNKSDGVFEYWINDQLQTRKDSLNWHGDWNENPKNYMINAVFFENYWNAGSPKEQERYFDNIVISTSRIGCGCEGVDSDQDGIPDDKEIESSVYQIDVDDRLLDADADGLSNAEEYFADTDPLDSSSVLKISKMEMLDDQITFCFQTSGLREYSLEQNSMFLSGNWDPVPQSAVTGNGDQTCLSIQAPLAEATFFRLVAR
jgi:hypothetical protein